MKIFLSTIMPIFISGCAIISHTDSAGNTTRYYRIGSQQLSGLIIQLPNGAELLLEEQKSELEKLISAAVEGAIKGIQK